MTRLTQLGHGVAAMLPIPVRWGRRPTKLLLTFGGAH
jgi:hypothetical protein